MNNSPSAVVTYSYNNLGQLASKQYGGGSGVSVDLYSYNIQGWLSEQNSSKFNLKLRYYDPLRNSANKSYSGNISEVEWQHKGVAPTQAVHTYSLSYDKVGRLTNTNHYENSTLVNKYAEQGITYDHNGNISTLKRYNNGALQDNFSYSYTGNKLQSVNGDTVFAYDANGNTTKDGRRGLDFEYNSLNLLSKVNTGASVNALYSWSADGVKRSVKAGVGTNGFEYLGSLVYKRTNGVLSLESARFGEGRIYVTEVKYYVTDHLGSVRSTINQNGVISDQSDYYPFGERYSTIGNATSSRDLFNGKETQTTGNVDLLDYGARMYDTRLGRWLTQDPLAEKYYSMSPYNYCANNPIKYIDPTGMDIWEIDKYGYVIKQIKDKEQDAFYLVDAEGKRMNREGSSISFAYGTVKSVTNASAEYNGTKLQMTMFNIDGADNASKLFETMSNAREVEWSNSEVEKNGLVQNIVGTTHLASREAVGGYLMQEGYRIKKHVHNHMTPNISQDDKKFNEINSAEMILNTDKRNG